MVLKKLEVGPYAANCYIVADEATREGIIVDAGDEPDRILKTVRELGLTVKLVVLTHGHQDHIQASKKIKEATGAPVAIHADDARLIEEQKAYLHGTAAPDRLLQGGDKVDFGGLSLTVLHTPGHSPGSISLLGDGVLFTGDTLFNLGIGRYDFPGGNYRNIMNSIHTKLMVLPDSTVVYPGHGPETTIGAERRFNPFLTDQG
ncbi:MAG: MBL fold metallo-hydrolase [Chloroflexi bacterium]|nr:MBL fold metallo-hydrolase [Chloroflexota bacterium]